MTWFTTWPSNGRPQYAEHATEQAAANHADQIIRSKQADVATYFETGQLEATT